MLKHLLIGCALLSAPTLTDWMVDRQFPQETSYTTKQAAAMDAFVAEKVRQHTAKCDDTDWLCLTAWAEEHKQKRGKS